MKKEFFSALMFLLLITIVPNARAFSLQTTVTGGSGSWSDGVYTIAPRSSGDQTLTFSVTPSGGTGPYSTCWDYMAAPIDAVKLGDWNKDYDLICYDYNSGIANGQQSTETYTFKQAGRYEVLVAVEDSNGNIEKSVLQIEYPMSNTVYDVTQDCGSNNLVAGGTDNGVKFENCVVSKGSGYFVMEFPAGTYVMNSQQNLDNGNYDGIEIRPKNEGDVVTISTTFRSTKSSPDAGAQDIPFLDLEPAAESYIHHMNLYRDFQGNEPHERDGMAMIRKKSINGLLTLEFSTMSNFGVGLGSGAGPALVFKNNWMNWAGFYGQASDESKGNCHDVGGGEIECYRSLFYHTTKSMIRQNYNTVDPDGSSHFIYSGDYNSFFYWVDNYIDFSSLLKTPGFNYNTGSSNLYHYHNIILSRSRINDYTNTIDGREYIENIFNGGSMWVVTDTGGSEGFLLNDNKFKNTGAPHLSSVNNNLVTITDNEFGSGASAPYWDFNPAFGGFGDCNNADDANVINPTCTGATWSGNIDTNTDFDTSNPGAWEYAPPTNNGVSATDSGSGMGSTPRFPFSQGALAQGVSSDGHTFSEIHTYADRGSIDETQIRYADVDHNWAGLATLSSNCGNSVCDTGETCSSCPGDCLTGANQICCAGTLYTGDCCSTSDCPGSDTCQNHVCTAPVVTCPNSLCDSGETCSTCPEDCLDAGEVCCSGIAYTGNCCSDQDCTSSQTCSGHTCTASGQPPAYGIKEYWSQGVPLNLMSTPPEEGHLIVQIPDDPAQVREARVLVLGYDLDAPLGQEGHYFVNGHGPIVLVGIESCNNMDCWLNFSIDKSWLIQGDNDIHFIHNATAGYNIVGLGVRLETSHRADASGEGCIDMTELIAFITLWYQDSIAYPITEMMDAVGLWKSGTGCT